MELNEKVVLTPSRAQSTPDDEVREREGRVVYVHSQGRYYVVEFRSPVTGETWREVFYPPEQSGTDYRDATPRLPRRN